MINMATRLDKTDIVEYLHLSHIYLTNFKQGKQDIQTQS